MTLISPSQTNQDQQQNYLFWLKDRGLADAPSHTPTLPSVKKLETDQQGATLTASTTGEQATNSAAQRRTQVHICHIMNSCQEFKRRPREIELFRKIILALNLSKEHYVVADSINLKQKLDLFEPAHFILWGLSPDHDAQIQGILRQTGDAQVVKTNSPSQILKSPQIKRDVWQRISSLKLS